LIYIGWCYEHGHLNAKTPSHAREIAEVHYELAAEQGFMDAQKYLDHMKQQ
jgi:TPR repeat protein